MPSGDPVLLFWAHTRSVWTFTGEWCARVWPVVPSGLQFENQAKCFFSFSALLCFRVLKLQKPTQCACLQVLLTLGPEIMKQAYVCPFSPPLALGSVPVWLHYCTDPQSGISVVVFSQSPTASILAHSVLRHLYGELVHKTSILILCYHFSKIHTTFFIPA